MLNSRTTLGHQLLCNKILEMDWLNADKDLTVIRFRYKPYYHGAGQVIKRQFDNNYIFEKEILYHTKVVRMTCQFVLTPLVNMSHFLRSMYRSDIVDKKNKQQQ